MRFRTRKKPPLLFLVIVFSSSFNQIGGVSPPQPDQHIEQQIPLPPSQGPYHSYRELPTRYSSPRRRPGQGKPNSLSLGDIATFNRKLLRVHERHCGKNRLCLDNAASSRCNKCFPCACDVGCHSYGDCCPDVALEAFDSSTAPRPFTGSDTNVVHCVNTAFSLVGLAHLHPHLRPIAVPTSNDRSGTSSQGVKPYVQSYYMVGICPHSFTHDSQLCEDDSYEPPVTSNADNTTFKNVHCARCHGYKDVTLWNVDITCETRQNLTSMESPVEAVADALEQPDCSVFYIPPPNADIRKCYSSPNMISSCNVTGKWPLRDLFTERACHSYTTPKEVDGVLYKNPFCYLCNHHDDKRLGMPRCPSKPWARRASFVGTVEYASLVEERRGDLAAMGDVEEEKLCDHRGINDRAESMCRSVRCPLGHQMVGGTCKPLFESARGLGYELYFGLQSDHVFDISDDHSLLHDIQDDMEKFTNGTLLKGKFKFQYFAMAFNRTDSEGRCSPSSATALGMYARLVSEGLQDQGAMEKALLRTRHTSFNVTTRRQNLTFQSYPSELPWHVMHPSRHESSLTHVSCVFLVQNNHLEQRRDGLRVVGTTTPDPSIPRPPPFIRVSGLLYCPQVELMTHEYTVSGLDEDLQLSWTDETLPSSRYLMDLEGNVTICLSDFLSKIESPKRTSLEVILAYVLLSVSMVLVVLCLLVYSLFAALRTLPGRNNMVLLAALFLSQGTLLCGYLVEHLSLSCVVMGVFTHYFALVVLCALTVCSYHVYTIFTTMHLAENIPRENRAFCLYIVFVLNVPLAIVAFVLVIYALNFASASALGYGYRPLCFLTSAKATWLALFIPLLVSFIINSVLFCRTCATLRQNKDIETNATDERHVHFYFRAAVLMFIMWVVYVIASVLALAELRVAFIILQCLLGIYVFVALVMNRRVLGLLYSLICEGNQAKKGDEDFIKLDSVGASTSGDSNVVVMAFRRTSSEHRSLAGNGHGGGEESTWRL